MPTPSGSPRSMRESPSCRAILSWRRTMRPRPRLTPSGCTAPSAKRRRGWRCCGGCTRAAPVCMAACGKRSRRDATGGSQAFSARWRSCSWFRQSLEVAIEVALGSRLQDVVVATWSNAEAAIAHLKQSGAGRATFQPLDTVRADRAGQHATEAQELPGVLGVAADLVSAPARRCPGRCRAAGTDARRRRPGHRASGVASPLLRVGASSPSPARSPAPVAR